jgi:hypothetical protein
MIVMKEIENQSSQEEATTSRRVFPSDHKLLRRMAFEEEKTITQVLDEVFAFVKTKIELEGLKILPEVNDTSKSSTHKAVRLSVDFNDFLNEQSENSGNEEIGKISSKKLLSACLLFYINNR